MVDQDLFTAFEKWFNADVKDDPEWASASAQQVVEWAQQRRIVDEVLMLPASGQAWREYFSVHHQSQIGSLQPEGGRVGGDHDRGFSPALNGEMRRRLETLSEGNDGRRPESDQARHHNPVRPPLKNSHGPKKG
jgi:hypothetical protein